MTKNVFEGLSNWGAAQSNVLADGQYLSVIKAAGIGHDDKNNANYLFFDLYIPKNQITRTPKYYLKDDTKVLGLVKGVLTVLGIDPNDTASIEFELEQRVGKALEIQVATSGKYQNIYFRRLLDEVPADIEAEDIPF